MASTEMHNDVATTGGWSWVQEFANIMNKETPPAPESEAIGGSINKAVSLIPESCTKEEIRRFIMVAIGKATEMLNERDSSGKEAVEMMNVLRHDMDTGINRVLDWEDGISELREEAKKKAKTKYLLYMLETEGKIVGKSKGPYSSFGKAAEEFGAFDVEDVFHAEVYDCASGGTINLV